MPSDLDIELDAELAANPSLANTAPSSPTPTETPATPVAQATPEAPAASAAPTPTPEPPAAAQEQERYAGARDYAQRALAYQQAAQYGDDAAFINAMIAGQQTAQQQLAEARQLAQYGQLWLQQQAQQQRPAPAAAPDPLEMYKVPQFNQQWMQHVEQTPTGWKLREGGDPAALAQINAYQNRRTEIADKLLSNPAEFLQPLVAKMVQEQASQLVQESFQQNQQAQYVNSFMQQNAGWLFQRDAGGNPVVNPVTQKPIISPAGQRFYQYLRNAEQMGITSPAAQEEYAKAKLSVDLLQPQAQQQTAVANNANAKQQLLNQMNRNPDRSGTTVAQSGARGLAEQNSNLSLADRMTAALRAAGETDETIAAAMAG